MVALLRKSRTAPGQWMFFLQSEFKKKVWYTLGHTTLFLYMRKSTATTIEGAAERRRRVASAEAHEAVSTKPEKAADAINLEEEIFGSIDDLIQTGFEDEEREVEQRGTSLYAHAEQVRAMGREGFGNLNVSPRATLEVVRSFLDGGWIAQEDLTPEVERGIAELERLHVALESRIAALPKDDARIDLIRRTLFDNPKFAALAHRVIEGFKDIAKPKYDALAEPIEEASRVALLRSEELEGYIAAYPELGEVYEAEKDTISAARKSFRSRICLPSEASIYIPNTLREINALREIVEGRAPMENELSQKYAFKIGGQSRPLQMYEARDLLKDLEGKYLAALRAAQSRFVIGDIKAQRIFTYLGQLSTADQRAVLEISEDYDVDSQVGRTPHGKIEYVRVAFKRFQRVIDTPSKQISPEDALMLLREELRAEILEKCILVNDEGRDRVHDLREQVIAYTSALRGTRRHGIEPIVIDGATDISHDWRSMFELIAVYDPNFFADVVSILSINRQLDGYHFTSQLGREIHTSIFGNRDVHGIPYLDQSSREATAARCNQNMERAKALTESEMRREISGNEKGAIFTAEQGVAAVERIQLAALRALADKDARLQVDRGTMEQRVTAEVRDLRQQLQRLSRELSTVESEKNRAEIARDVAKDSLQSAQKENVGLREELEQSKAAQRVTEQTARISSEVAERRLNDLQGVKTSVDALQQWLSERIGFVGISKKEAQIVTEKLSGIVEKMSEVSK